MGLAYQSIGDANNRCDTVWRTRITTILLCWIASIRINAGGDDNYCGCVSESYNSCNLFFVAGAKHATTCWLAFKSPEFVVCIIGHCSRLSQLHLIFKFVCGDHRSPWSSTNFEYRTTTTLFNFCWTGFFFYVIIVVNIRIVKRRDRRCIFVCLGVNLSISGYLFQRRTSTSSFIVTFIVTFIDPSRIWRSWWYISAPFILFVFFELIVRLFRIIVAVIFWSTSTAASFNDMFNYWNRYGNGTQKINATPHRNTRRRKQTCILRTPTSRLC